MHNSINVMRTWCFFVLRDGLLECMGKIGVDPRNSIRIHQTNWPSIFRHFQVHSTKRSSYLARHCRCHRSYQCLGQHFQPMRVKGSIFHHVNFAGRNAPFKINAWNLKITYVWKKSFDPNLHYCVPAVNFQGCIELFRRSWGEFRLRIRAHFSFVGHPLVPWNSHSWFLVERSCGKNCRWFFTNLPWRQLCTRNSNKSRTFRLNLGWPVVNWEVWVFIFEEFAPT